ncbi:MAG: hypothetical protein HY885_16340 [Deltaproteobacteria bacterium]|nr:hypothetical protein [Deltaproteobacteria bacterium]
MKKQRLLAKAFTCGLMVTAYVAGVDVGGSAAYMGILEEGIPYQAAEMKKSTAGHHHNRATLGATMVEGIGYQEAVIGENSKVINLNHKKMMEQGREACVCEDPSSL